jgi:SprT protein
MMAYDTIREIRQVVQETLEKLGRTDVQARVMWNRRFKSRIADASAKSGLIRIGILPWSLMDDATRRETIIHETCHLVTPDHHGRQWRAAMRRCGVEPRRTCDNEELKGLHKPKPRPVAARCGCGEHPITKTLGRRIANGVAQYRCGRCKSLITLTEKRI